MAGVRDSSGPHDAHEAGRPGGCVYVLTREAARKVDELAASRFAIPGLVLMENAAFHLSDVVLSILEDRALVGGGSAGVLVVAGTGNNGGDGLAAARHLHNAGLEVRIVLGGPDGSLSPDAEANLRIVRAMGLVVHQVEGDAGKAVDRAFEELGGAAGHPGVVVDAVLGTGLRAGGELREPAATLISRINSLRQAGWVVVSADVPSGLDCETGEPVGMAVRADVTVTFVGLKEGFLTLPAQEYLGDVVVADIGAPVELTRELGRPLPVTDVPRRPGDDERVAGEPGGPGAAPPRAPGR